MRTIYQSSRFNNKCAIRNFCFYFFSCTPGHKKKCAYIVAIFLKDFKGQQPSAENSPVEHADQVRVRVRGRLDLVGMHTCYICLNVNYVVPEVLRLLIYCKAVK